MKYFTTTTEPEKYIGTAADAKAYLKANPDVQTVCRWWWCRDDLIECAEYTREQLLTRPAKANERGATAHWAVDHHQL